AWPWPTALFVSSGTGSGGGIVGAGVSTADGVGPSQGGACVAGSQRTPLIRYWPPLGSVGKSVDQAVPLAFLSASGSVGRGAPSNCIQSLGCKVPCVIPPT